MITIKNILLMAIVVLAITAIQASAVVTARMYYRNAATGQFEPIEGDSGGININGNITGGSSSTNFDTRYFAVADSIAFVWGNIDGDSEIIESRIDKIDPITKLVLWTEVYEWLYDIKGRLIQIVLK